MTLGPILEQEARTEQKNTNAERRRWWRRSMDETFLVLQLRASVRLELWLLGSALVLALMLVVVVLPVLEPWEAWWSRQKKQSDNLEADTVGVRWVQETHCW